MVNLLIGENRMIVSDIPGTTRDAIDSRIERGGVEYTFIDTAGLRRKSKIADEVERYSIIRAIAAVDRADVVLMMVDAQTGVTEQDSKIAGIAHNRFIPTIIVVNKWDLIEKDTKTMQKMTGDIRNSLAFMPYAPMLFISAKTGKRAEKIYDKIQYVVTQSRKRVLTAKLNEALIDFVSLKEPPSKNGRRLKLFYGSQVDIAPPTFVIFVNDDTLMHFSYKRYLENKINETFDFDGTPFRLLIRNREKED